VDHFIRINIPFSTKINFSFFRNPDMQMAMADQNTYVPHLLQMYNEGYRLLSFQLTRPYPIPLPIPIDWGLSIRLYGTR
jgi:hypothetical protein